MKQIYNFDNGTPPALYESALRAKLEKRKQKKIVTLVAIAGLLLMTCIIMLAVFTFKTNPLLSRVCTAYVFVAFVGIALIAIVFAQKGGIIKNG